MLVGKEKLLASLGLREEEEREALLLGEQENVPMRQAVTGSH